MSRRVVSSRPVIRVARGTVSTRPDDLAVEEPMEVRIGGQPVSVTMRTPGHDFELALGFCLTEGLVPDPGLVAQIRYCGSCRDDDPERFNTVDVRLRGPVELDEALRRHVTTTSACGICGTSTIEAVRRDVPSVAGDDVVLDAALVAELPERLRGAQTVFDRTGGLHAAGLFTATGELRCVREDVGRHNAVDKVVGWAAMQRALPLTGHVLVVSGRVAFEIVRKALRAGIPAVVAVSAPTSLAVQLAESAGMTLAGFVRDGGMNVYAGADRLGIPG